MKRGSLKFLPAALLAALCWGGPAAAQDTGHTGEVVRTGRNPSGERAGARRSTVTTGTRRGGAGRRTNPQTGDLAVASAPGALLEVAPVGVRGERPRSRAIPPGEGLISFDDLKPGRYRVSARLDGHEPAQEELEVRPNRVTALTLELEPVTYNVVIRTNVRVGEVRYAREGEQPRVARVSAGRAVLRELREGRYGVEVWPEELGFERLRTAFSLPAPDGQYEFTYQLRNLLSTQTLSEPWLNLNGWESPAGWRAAAGVLYTGAAGVLLPRNPSYRHYADFKLVADVQMQSEAGISLALRAQDQRNYYLIQLTGARADEPYALRSFVVRDGAPQQLQPPVSLYGYSDILQPKKHLTLTVIARDNRLCVLLRENSLAAAQRAPQAKPAASAGCEGTLDDLPLGEITDPNRQFRVGAVGVAALAGERNEFTRFVVCNFANCPPE